ncbi:UNVERIFIED_CONTAM: Nucleosome assembly protein 1 [Sesamum radiatum]|uniref:Nucleosome assembly protein 1 n=1 Tax=Sesamum radiatum TaxID=300843 RepID=A0AAW2PFV4_SESRA
METLSPKVRKRVEALREIQSQHDELEGSFLRREPLLKLNTRNFMNTIYKSKGVPEFWLTAMKTNDILSEEISERDEEALKYLKDIKWCKIDDPKGFKLEFFFDTNPFFKNSVLTKTYHMIDDVEPILEKAIGQMLDSKGFEEKAKEGAKNAKPIIKTEKCESFFNFFNPPEIPDDEDEIDEDEAEELQNLMEQDYEIGSTIRDKIIPRAVSWFTGEAVQGDELDMADDDDNEDDDEDDDEEVEDEDEDDDEDEEEVKGKKKVKRLFGK